MPIRMKTAKGDGNTKIGKCPSCHHKGITVTSGTDGRPKYVCQSCRHTWSEGKKLNQGYKTLRRNR